MVIEVFAAQRQSVDPLRQHLTQWMLDPVGPSTIRETPGQASQQTDSLVGLPQQQRTPISGERPGVELRRDLPRKMGFKLEAVLATLRHSGSRLLSGQNLVWKLSYAPEDGFSLVVS